MHRILAIGAGFFCMGVVLAVFDLLLIAYIILLALLLGTGVVLGAMWIRRYKGRRLSSVAISNLERSVMKRQCVLMIISVIMFAIGAIYATQRDLMMQGQANRLLDLSRNSQGSVLTVAILDGEPTDTPVGISVPGRILSVYGESGMVSTFHSTLFLLDLSVGRKNRKQSVNGFNSGFEQRFYTSAAALRPGDVVSAYLRFKTPPAGPFAASLLRKGISVIGHGSIYGVNRLYTIVGWTDFAVWQAKLMMWLEGRVTETFGSQAGGLVLAFAIGDRTLLNRQVIQAFAKLGIIHAFIASGATIRMVLSPIVYLMKRKMRSRPGLICLIAAGGVIWLLVLTDLAPPALRAGIVYVYDVWAQALGRKPDRVTANAVAALVLVLMGPRLLIDPGVVLSFAAVTTLSLLPGRIATMLPRLKVPRRIRAVISRGVAAEIGITPLVMAEFGWFSLLSLFINIVLYPILEWVLPISLLLLTGSALRPQIGMFIGPILEMLASFIERAILYVVSLPVVLKIGGFSYVHLAIYYGVISLMFFAQNRYRRRQSRQYSR